MNMIDIIYWSDYACPFCYIGEKNLKTALKNTGLDKNCSLSMRSFELHPGAPDVIEGSAAELIAKKYGLPLEEAARQVQRIEEMGREAGIDFHYSNAKYSGTFDAHRLTKYVQAEENAEKEDRLINLLFRAIFEEGERLSDRQTLLQIAENAGLDRKEAEAVLNSERYADDVRGDERQAEQLGIHAVPYFVINQAYAIPGALPAKEMEKVLLQIMEREVKGKPDSSSGSICGPDGC